MKPSYARREEGVTPWHSVCYDLNNASEQTESSFQLLSSFTHHLPQQTQHQGPTSRRSSHSFAL